MWFVSYRRYQAALTEIETLRRRVVRTEARHDEVEGKRRNLARMLAEATAKRLSDGTSPEDADALHRRIAHLEKQLDDALGLNTPAVEDGKHWQGRRMDKPSKGVG